MGQEYPVWRDLVDRRLAELGSEQPDLSAAIDLQRALVGRLIALAERMDAIVPLEPIAPGAVAARLRQGVPALRDDTVVLPASELAPALPDLCDLLAGGGAGDAARHIADAFRQRRIDPGSLLAVSFARDERAIRTFANQTAFAPDLLWLVAELVAGPFAYVLQQRAFAAESARDARAAWQRGYCPACGSWPALAELTSGERRLRCSFCAASWRPAACRCVYCAEEGTAFMLVVLDLDRPALRLELCDACGGYLKSIEASGPMVYPLLTVEDMATTALDVAAMERGYTRPRLPDIGLPLARVNRVNAECRMPNAESGVEDAR